MRKQGRITGPSCRTPRRGPACPLRAHSMATGLTAQTAIGLLFPGRSPPCSSSRASAPSGCCAAACASSPPTTRRCSAQRSRSITSRIAQIAKSRARGTRSSGQPGGDEPATGDVSRSSAGVISGESSFNRATQARRQAGRHSSRSSMPRRSSAATRRARCCAISTRRFRAPTKAGCRAASTSATSIRSARALKVSSNRAAAQLLQQVGFSHGDLLRPAARDRVAAAGGAFARARHRRGDAARADRGLQRLREPGRARLSAHHLARRGRRRERRSGFPRSATRQRSARQRRT